MSQCTVVYPLKFSYQCIVKQNAYFVTNNLVSLVATIASILIFFGCLSFVVVVFHSSKICIQLPFLCDFVFVAHNESHVHFVNYSETSNSGPSEKGTLYYKPLYRGQFMGPENPVSL